MIIRFGALSRTLHEILSLLSLPTLSKLSLSELKPILICYVKNRGNRFSNLSPHVPVAEFVKSENISRKFEQCGVRSINID